MCFADTQNYRMYNIEFHDIVNISDKYRKTLIISPPLGFMKGGFNSVVVSVSSSLGLTKAGLNSGMVSKLSRKSAKLDNGSECGLHEVVLISGCPLSEVLLLLLDQCFSVCFQIF